MINPFTMKYPALTWWKFLNMGALGIAPIAFLGSIAFTYNWNENPLLWRVFSPKAITIGPGDHHALIMLLFAIIFLLCVQLKIPPLITAIGVFFYVYSYEAEWYVAYAISHNYWGGPFQWDWMLLAVNCIPAIFGYIYLFGVPGKFLASMGAMFAGWFAIGFPITNDFPGRTDYFFNLNVNALEISTHVLAGVFFFYFVYPQLKRFSAKYKMNWSSDFDPLVNYIRGWLHNITTCLS